MARKGWNGKKQYIQLATGISYKTADGEIVNCEHDAIGNMAISFVGTSGVQMGWLASQADMLAEDWVFANCAGTMKGERHDQSQEWHTLNQCAKENWLNGIAKTKRV